MNYHEQLEQAMDDAAPDRGNKVADVREVLGDDFAEPWAHAYASMILDEWIGRGLSNRRRYLTKDEDAEVLARQQQAHESRTVADRARRGQ